MVKCRGLMLNVRGLRSQLMELSWIKIHDLPGVKLRGLSIGSQHAKKSCQPLTLLLRNSAYVLHVHELNQNVT